MNRFLALVFFLPPLLSSCVVGPEPGTPQISVNNWQGAQQTSTNEPIDRAWWRSFKDPWLRQLVSDVRRSNLDLALADARLAEARSNRRVSAASLFPQISASSSASRTRISDNDPNFPDIPFLPRQIGQDRYEAGFDASWELDLFGKNRRATQAADARLQAAQFSRSDILLTVMAEAAREYIQLRGTQKRIQLLQENIALQERSLELIEANVQSGLARQVDLSRSQSQLASLRAQKPPLEADLRASCYRLSLLTGRQPGSLFAQLEKAKPLPEMEETVPLGLKSDLLRRRPDIRQAEATLHAATADLGVAVAQLYPSVSLTGNLGFTSDSPSNLIDQLSDRYLIGSFVRVPIFEAGRLRGQIQVAEARESQAAIQYEKTVLEAFVEIETVLTRYAKEQETRLQLRQAVQAAQETIEQAQTLYDQGLSPLLDLLLAQQELARAQDTLAQSETRLRTQLISLYKALGGGWEVR